MRKPIAEVLDARRQESLTPEGVLEELMSGNQRFVEGAGLERDYRSQARASLSGQYPKAVILSCIDSRVPVELIFDQGIGDVFVGRVAGNVESDHMLGSLEYACKVAGSKLLLVLGHEHCGAIKSAIQQVKLGNITSLLSAIEPAVAATEAAGRSAEDAAYVAEVVCNNVQQTLARIRYRSPILAEMEEKGEIALRGGVYALQLGKVTLL